ncbi:MAG: hypothetical protein ACO1SV_14745 [Fimbriimonas sp.]
MEDIFGGICDLFSFVLDWAPDAVDVVDTVVDFLPDGDASAAPTNRRHGQPDDAMVDG